jgi:dienelactone hydrolase
MAPPETDRATTHVTPDDERPLMDDPVGVVIIGRPPAARVSVRAEMDLDGVSYQSTGVFVADPAGTVDTTVAPSVDGTYTGVDPFGLWWSAQPVGPGRGARPPGPPVPAVVHVRDGANVETVAVTRHWLAGGATVTAIHQPGVSGRFARPAGPGPFPAVVAFAGSSGGLAAAASWAPVLASHGFATLAIAYFGTPGLPPSLIGIDVEVVERAVHWLRRRSDITDEPIAVMGMSRGSELAFHAGALLDDVGPVVGLAPSGIGWPALDATGPIDAPAWRFRGRDLPYVAPPRRELVSGPNADRPIALRPLFEALLQDTKAVAAAEIPVEHLHGPVLLVSGRDDAMWPATVFGDLAHERARRHQFPHGFTHLSYPDAGHVAAGVPGLPVVTEARHPLTGACYAFGGSRAGNARARADSWPRIISFLRAATTGASAADAHRERLPRRSGCDLSG